MKIGELAQVAQCTVETVRYYQSRGLLRVQGGRLHDLSLAAADATSWMLGYDYSLSKRTLIYTALNHTGNDATVRYAADTFNRPTAGGRARLFGLGVRHNF